LAPPGYSPRYGSVRPCPGSRPESLRWFACLMAYTALRRSVLPPYWPEAMVQRSSPACTVYLWPV